jgi:hypothetical protein
MSNNEDTTGIFKIGDLVTNKTIFSFDKRKSHGIIIKTEPPVLIFERHYVWWFHDNSTILEYSYNLEYIKNEEL